jgi:hypothetical protein
VGLPRLENTPLITQLGQEKQYRLLLAALPDKRKAAGLSQVKPTRGLEPTKSVIGKCGRGQRRLDVIELRELCCLIGVPVSTMVNELESAISRLETVKPNAGEASKRRSD